jgi:hypothetical protein
VKPVPPADAFTAEKNPVELLPRIGREIYFSLSLRCHLRRRVS